MDMESESRADTDGGKTRTRRLEYDMNNFIMCSSTVWFMDA